MGDITGLSTPDLTATAPDVPLSHDGGSTFTLELAFSEDVPLGYRTLRDDAFTVVGVSVLRAHRLDPPNYIRWRIRGATEFYRGHHPRHARA